MSVIILIVGVGLVVIIVVCMLRCCCMEWLNRYCERNWVRKLLRLPMKRKTSDEELREISYKARESNIARTELKVKYTKQPARAKSVPPRLETTVFSTSSDLPALASISNPPPSHPSSAVAVLNISDQPSSTTTPYQRRYTAPLNLSSIEEQPEENLIEFMGPTIECPPSPPPEVRPPNSIEKEMGFPSDRLVVNDAEHKAWLKKQVERSVEDRLEREKRRCPRCPCKCNIL